MNFLSQFLHHHLNPVQLQHKHQDRHHQRKGPAAGAQKPLHRTLNQKHPLFPHLLNHTALNRGKNTRIFNCSFQRMHNVKLRKIRSQIQKINNTLNHLTDFIDVAPHRGGNLRHGQGSVLPPHDNIGARADEHAEPLALAKLTIGYGVHHAPDVAVLGR
ncbi:hypothetical protein V8G54_034075 [Vigna mungo]|uniref:Uncharacterized protein n=1 Tax=Vigna mungo TaxID=3915 RepID=A0AAQ3MPS8_VIGMU